MEVNKSSLMLFVFVALVFTIEAHVAEFDEVWQKRSEEAKRAALHAYEPNPEKVASHLNEKVHR